MRLQRQDGYTLVEVTLVLMILALLLAVGMVSLLGARKGAQNRAAQALAREAVTSAKTVFSATLTYAAVTVPALRAAEPSLVFVESTQESDSPRIVSVASVDSSTFIAAVRSSTGTCFFIRDEIATGKAPGHLGTTFAAVTQEEPCRANAPPPEFVDRW